MALISSDTYTGSTPPGFTAEGSYHRAIWNGQEESHARAEDVADLVQTCRRQMRDAERSRLIVRTRIEPGVSANEVRWLLGRAGVSECITYPDPGNGHTRLTAAWNSAERDLAAREILQVRRTIAAKLNHCLGRTATPATFRSFALGELQRMRALGLSVDQHPRAGDLQTLWEHSFGWSREQCEHYAEHPGEGSRAFVLRDESGAPLSGMLVCDGESTEWATVPERQGEGLITPLLIAAHCALVRSGVKSLFTELRWDRSISPAVKSGMRLADIHRAEGVLRNHVPIGDDLSADQPDPWNRERARLPDGTDARWLRSFAVAWLDPDLFDEELLAAAEHSSPTGGSPRSS